MTSVCVVGLGYIGLPTSAVLASRGVRVFGVDVNPAVVDTINQGAIHIVEPDLDGIVSQAVASGLLTAHTAPVVADVYIIAVPTPFTEQRRPDIRYVEDATRALAPVLRAGALVILESTSPVGTTERVAELLQEARPDLAIPQREGEHGDVAVAHCPERVLPGHVVRELIENDRIIGGLTAACTERAVAFYAQFVQGQCIATQARTAEMCKLTENAFRDVNIAFANELSLICDHLQIDVWELIRMANRHPRVNVLQPGCGVGGHCIAVDPWFIVDAAPQQSRLIRTAREVNDGKPHWVVDRFDAQVAAHGHDATRRYAVLGLAFKPDIDDLRESPALEIAQALSARYPGQLLFVEPNIRALPAALHVGGMLAGFDQAMAQADGVLLLVGHRAFGGLQARAGQWVLDMVGVTRRERAGA